MKKKKVPFKAGDFVKCVNKRETDHTLGKVYLVTRILSSKMFMHKCDRGSELEYKFIDYALVKSKRIGRAKWVVPKKLAKKKVTNKFDIDNFNLDWS